MYFVLRLLFCCCVDCNACEGGVILEDDFCKLLLSLLSTRFGFVLALSLLSEVIMSLEF